MANYLKPSPKALIEGKVCLWGDSENGKLQKPSRTGTNQRQERDGTGLAPGTGLNGNLDSPGLLPARFLDQEIDPVRG